MPEGFSVDICYDEPCHWTPPPIYDPDPEDIPLDLPQVETFPMEDNANRPIPGYYGDHQIHRNNKRAPEPQAPQNYADSSRQGPPLPEWPDADDVIEPIRPNTLSEIDPDLQKLAADRAEALKAELMKVSRPASFHDFMDARYILRPEAIESVFYMWRITGDPIWQDKGWHMWECIENVSWTELAYSAITNVNDADSDKADSMERYV
jgi:Glycosyl hydrolase family 47